MATIESTPVQNEEVPRVDSPTQSAPIDNKETVAETKETTTETAPIEVVASTLQTAPLDLGETESKTVPIETNSSTENGSIEITHTTIPVPFTESKETIIENSPAELNSTSTTTEAPVEPAAVPAATYTKPKQLLVEPHHIEDLRKLLSGTNAKIIVPGEEGYDKAILCWSRAAEKPAGVAIVPTNTHEVSIAVKYATDSGVELAVKGGGHSSAGASCTNGGILIDLSAMRGVRINEEERLIYVEGGALWGDVDAAAWKYGLATVGGTVAHTGVGGLTLGGGYGVLSGKYGLTIDNWVAATTVLASGEVVKSSILDEDPDLFWAMRGAGQNFGVTTEFVLRGYPQTEVYMGMMSFEATPEIIDKVVEATNNMFLFKDTPTGPKTKGQGVVNSVIGFARPPPNKDKTMVMVVTQVLTNDEAVAKEMVADYVALGPVTSTMRLGPYPDVNNLLPAPQGFRCSVKSSAFMPPLRTPFVLDALKRYEDFATALPDAKGTVIGWEWNDPSKIIANSKGCFANRGHHLNTIIMPMWTQVENDKICRDWARDISEHFKIELHKQGLETGHGVEGGASVRGKKGAILMYGNYDQTDDRSADIFGVNYPRLQKIKAKYDPTNKFNKLFAITPATS